MGLEQTIIAMALATGFDAAGVAPLEPGPDTRFLERWLARGFGGDMHYLERRAAERIDPRRVWPRARSAIVVALSYASEPAGLRMSDGGEATIARYAAGDDYHEVLTERLRALHAALEAWLGGPVAARPYVDTGPLPERALAARAGLGWIGKNACLIDPELGSYLLLGVLLVDLELAGGTPQLDHCGSCRACLDACPTAAFPEPGVLDATRCIAYTTIESEAPVPESLREAHGSHVFGCDVCQEVCPWNRRPALERLPDPLGLRARLRPRDPWVRARLAWMLELDESAWQEATRHTALRRARYRSLLRNALVAAGNARDPALRPALERHARGDDPLLAEHARWALARLAAAAGGD